MPNGFVAIKNRCDLPVAGPGLAPIPGLERTRPAPRAPLGREQAAREAAKAMERRETAQRQYADIEGVVAGNEKLQRHRSGKDRSAADLHTDTARAFGDQHIFAPARHLKDHSRIRQANKVERNRPIATAAGV